MLLGSLLVLLGYQMLWLWAYARIHGANSGILPENPLCQRLLGYLNIERCARVGGVLLLSGMGLSLWLLYRWHTDGQATLRCLLWALTAMGLGVQTIHGSFFLNMLGMTGRQRP